MHHRLSLHRFIDHIADACGGGTCPTQGNITNIIQAPISKKFCPFFFKCL